MADAWEDFVGDDHDRSAPRVARRADRAPAGRRVRCSSSAAANGTGETTQLAARFRLTGVDLSSEQLRRGPTASSGRRPSCKPTSRRSSSTPRRSTPSAPSTSSTTFRASCSQRCSTRFYTLAADRAACSSPRSASATNEGWHGEWLGVPMFFSSFPAETNTRLIVAAGFELLRDEVVTIAEPEGDVEFQWMLHAMSCDFSLDALPRAARGGEGRRLPLGGVRPAAGAGRPDPAPRRRPVARRRARGRRARGGRRRVVDVVPDDAVGLLQPRVAAKASARSSGCASSATASRTTPSGPTSISTSGSTRSSRGTTPTRSTCTRRSPARSTSWQRRSSIRTTTAPTRTSTGGTAARTSELARGASSGCSSSRIPRSGRSGRDDARDDGGDARRRPRRPARAAAGRQDRPLVSELASPRCSVRSWSPRRARRERPRSCSALRRNGEREVRLVGTDMSERSVGRHLCDAFHLVPAGSRPGVPGRGAARSPSARASTRSCRSRRSTSKGWPTHVDRFPMPVLVSSPDAIRALERQGGDVRVAAPARRARRPSSGA